MLHLFLSISGTQISNSITSALIPVFKGSLPLVLGGVAAMYFFFRRLHEAHREGFQSLLLEAVGIFIVIAVLLEVIVNVFF